MKRIAIVFTIFVFFVLVVGVFALPTQTPVQTAPQPGTPVMIPISRHSESHLALNTQGVFGPQICTAYGDPFSPWNSVWEPGSYTYSYRIKIPADYAEDVVRVEIFDPDSINATENRVTVFRSSNAQNHPSSPLPISASKFCGINGGSADQANPCVIRTDELTLTIDSVIPTYSFDQINPYWFVRIDENRGGGDPANHGNGECTTIKDSSGRPIYDPLFNTQTLFTLYYLKEVPDNPDQRVDLASYLGNTGDGRPGDANHLTDMHWVSPGADKQGPDYPIPDVSGVSEVPTVEGNSSFEVNLNSDVANIATDPITGERYLYLDVQTLSGASENGFYIWAGPATYVDTTPSEVNSRNLLVLNMPGAHYSNGVEVEAIGRLPANNVHKSPASDPPLLVPWPVADFLASDAGKTVNVGLFDVDSGANGPITFFFDTIPEADWSLTFSNPNGDPDPDGKTGRCLIGGDPWCNNIWIDPCL